MTPEAQRIAIAEAFGWTQLKPHSLYPERLVGMLPKQHPNYHASNSPCDTVPDYLSDLNAMHEAEDVLSDARVQRYVDHLANVTNAHLETNGVRYGVNYWSIYHATASQRAEAFLRTLNLWDDNK